MQPKANLIDYYNKSIKELEIEMLASSNDVDQALSSYDDLPEYEGSELDDMEIEEIPQINGVISIKNERRWAHPSYQDAYRVGPVDVQLIVKEELPDYTEIDGVRIANFGYSISQKIGMTNDLHSKITGRGGVIDEQYHKHISDMKEMIIKFNSLKWKQPD
jgi:hypothetical protein